jgi:hypothetical protein
MFRTFAFSSLRKVNRVKNIQDEATAVSTVRRRSPNEEVRPRKKGEAYKFGLNSHPPMRLAGKFNSRQRSRTNHKEIMNAAVFISLRFFFAIQNIPAITKNKEAHAAQTSISNSEVS